MNRVITSCFLLLALAACGRRDEAVRHYTEVGGTPLAPAAASPGGGPFAGGMPIPPNISLAWKTPSGWQETPGSGFRLASFTAGEAECAIIAFPDAMGGADAKISMWLSQLNAPAPQPERLVSFLAAPENIMTEGGITCSLYDLTPLLDRAPAQSIIAGLIVIDGKQVAIRMKGSPAALSAQTSAFRSLCQSLVKK